MNFQTRSKMQKLSQAYGNDNSGIPSDVPPAPGQKVISPVPSINAKLTAPPTPKPRIPGTPPTGSAAATAGIQARTAKSTADLRNSLGDK